MPPCRSERSYGPPLYRGGPDGLPGVEGVSAGERGVVGPAGAVGLAGLLVPGPGGVPGVVVPGALGAVGGVSVGLLVVVDVPVSAARMAESSERTWRFCWSVRWRMEATLSRRALVSPVRRASP